jgi:hypothetical protein
MFRKPPTNDEGGDVPGNTTHPEAIKATITIAMVTLKLQCLSLVIDASQLELSIHSLFKTTPR